MTWLKWTWESILKILETSKSSNENSSETKTSALVIQNPGKLFLKRISKCRSFEIFKLKSTLKILKTSWWWRFGIKLKIGRLKSLKISIVKKKWNTKNLEIHASQHLKLQNWYYKLKIGMKNSHEAAWDAPKIRISNAPKLVCAIFPKISIWTRGKSGNILMKLLQQSALKIPCNWHEKFQSESKRPYIDIKEWKKKKFTPKKSVTILQNPWTSM